MGITHVVSFSGGRTSGRLVREMVKKIQLGWDVRFVFMDTGAEHPETYKFIREVVAKWGIELICLRVLVNPELGKANSYKVISIDEIGPDLQPWIDVMAKYGIPYFGGAFCTRTMKIEVCERFCKENFGDYRSWLGMRVDEPARIWGAALFPKLRRMNFDNYMMIDLYRDLSQSQTHEQMRETLETHSMIFGDVATEIINRVISIAKSKQRFMAEIMDDEKQDVLDWWNRQPFDLGIPEHLGNCVFCIKKGINKVALAMRDEPEMLEKFREAVMSPDVRVVERRQQKNKIMYRKGNSLDSIEVAYSSLTRDEIAATMLSSGGEEPGSCTESCEAFIVGNSDSAKMDLFANQEKAA